MATDTFTWCARVEASEQVAVSVIQAQFGDGYKQVAGRGINDQSESWSLTCNGNKTAMAEVRTFLRSHVTASFWWTNPWGEKNLYRVKADSINPKFVNGSFAEIAFTFEQAFAP
ncbi:phage tail protein [Pantoea allii]|uniref:phage tail protein n=1 Tax=Pantoea allii TaxID=574096 RepID=UPI000A223D86|nr:phage tail protein [Pantoea allii]MBW1251950.1 phage tail protein [Pantoea allii]MBW1260547.1 phage tail protein [Pantoea allii]MBW1283144.1 phage tail protein [Pantoea allii]ORM84807.1 phage tail protein [Pantoea allii]PBJ98727.1 phage tail protein [Pantoea allii]